MLVSSPQPIQGKWPKILPPRTSEHERISDDFVKYWHGLIDDLDRGPAPALLSARRHPMPDYLPQARRALQPLAVDWSRNVWSDGSLAKRARTRQEHPLLSREYHRIPRL